MSEPVEIQISASAARCYARLCNVERATEWVPGVADVAVLERDGGGRALHARFTGMPARGSLAYELRYEYDDAAHAVRWRTAEVALRDLRGEARFAALDEGRCRMTYAISNATSDALPGWARTVLDEESAEKVAYAFRRWIER
jgi:ribosome-associated toxin RatA of RatAB toxin-antitoxin module